MNEHGSAEAIHFPITVVLPSVVSIITKLSAEVPARHSTAGKPRSSNTSGPPLPEHHLFLQVLEDLLGLRFQTSPHLEGRSVCT